MKSALNPTARRIADFIASHPGQTKHELSDGLHMPKGTLDGYIRALKIHGDIEASRTAPPRYRAGNGTPKPDDSTALVIASIRAMVSVGREGVNHLA
jgi:predicted transcriptional regulator